jgi:23S rRNA (cytosine1962-C5)-methyltransferase
MSKPLPKVILRSEKADAVKRFHPWIFSGAIAQADRDLADGDLVQVEDQRGNFLAIGHFNHNNIAVKVLSFEKFKDLEGFFLRRFQAAYATRSALGLTDNDQTNCYRLVNAEGDGLPGLVIDWYNGTAVILAYSIAMYRSRDILVDCLKAVYGDRLKAVYDKSASVLPKNYSSNYPAQNEYLVGDRRLDTVLEYGHEFNVDWETGQKSGFFLDQREHRQQLSQYVKGKSVLNTFCYSGGFSVYAVKAGASRVHSLDASARAMEWTTENVALNNPNGIEHESMTGDVFDYLTGCTDHHDVIILDPPAFAKNQSARHAAVMAYKRLNYEAFVRIKPGGIVMTFSCSQVVTPDLFKGAVVAGAIESGRSVQILDHLTQPGDHPTSLYHPEGLYLKGLVLRVG